MIYTFQVKVHFVIGPVIPALKLTTGTSRVLSIKADDSLQHLVLLGQRK